MCEEGAILALRPPAARPKGKWVALGPLPVMLPAPLYRLCQKADLFPFCFKVSVRNNQLDFGM